MASRSCWSTRRAPCARTRSPASGCRPSPSAMTEAPWPVELRLKRAAKRLESPSAEVQGHGAGEKTIVAGRAHVGIMDLEPVGNYAVRIKFDDLHDTGIFSWEYLYRLGVEHDRRWREYLAAIAARGLSREPQRT